MAREGQNAAKVDAPATSAPAKPAAARGASARQDVAGSVVDRAVARSLSLAIMKAIAASKWRLAETLTAKLEAPTNDPEVVRSVSVAIMKATAAGKWSLAEKLAAKLEAPTEALIAAPTAEEETSEPRLRLVN